METYHYKNREIRLMSGHLTDGGWVPRAQIILSTGAKELVHARKGDSSEPCKTREEADSLALKFAKGWIDSN